MGTGNEPAGEDLVSTRTKRRIVIAAMALAFAGLGGTALATSSSGGTSFLDDVAHRHPWGGWAPRGHRRSGPGPMRGPLAGAAPYLGLSVPELIRDPRGADDFVAHGLRFRPRTRRSGSGRGREGGGAAPAAFGL
jgi:hypothetical protein